MENLFGSMSLAADHPFRVGDFVKVQDFTGTVEEVRSTDHPMVRQFIEGNSQGPLGSF